MNSAVATPRLFGLPPFTYETLLGELSRYPAIERAVVFGSRAMGTYRPGSDVDICLFGEAVGWELALTVSGRLNEALPIPYYFDVLVFADIKSPELREHIIRHGRELYRSS